MNKKTKVLSVGLAMFAIAGLMGFFNFDDAFANPKGARDGDLGKMIGKWNVLIHPGEWSADDTVCPNSGKRMFFQDNGGHGSTIGVIHLDWAPGKTFKITDCDGTTDSETAAELNDGKFKVFVRLHGPITSELRHVCAEKVDVNDDETLCAVADITIKKNSHKFVKVAENLLVDGAEGVTFTLLKVGDKPVKNVEYRIYEVLG